MPATTLADFQICEVLGKGSFGEVHLGYDCVTRREVAIKVISFKLATEKNDVLQQELINRFESEAKIISTLKHPNILKLIDFGTTSNGRLYIVVALLEGEPLDTVLGHMEVG